VAQRTRHISVQPSIVMIAFEHDAVFHFTSAYDFSRGRDNLYQSEHSSTYRASSTNTLVHTTISRLHDVGHYKGFVFHDPPAERSSLHTKRFKNHPWLLLFRLHNRSFDHESNQCQSHFGGSQHGGFSSSVVDGSNLNCGRDQQPRLEFVVILRTDIRAYHFQSL
jgi:hypothetical protein